MNNANLYVLAFAVYQSFGKEAAKRMLTPPRNFIKKACERTGADYETALHERDEMVEETLEFFESMVTKDFEDPDSDED